MPYIKLNGGADFIYYEVMHLKNSLPLLWCQNTLIFRLQSKTFARASEANSLLFIISFSLNDGVPCIYLYTGLEWLQYPMGCQMTTAGLSYPVSETFWGCHQTSKHKSFCGALLSSVGLEADIKFNCAPHRAKSSLFLAGNAEGGSCLLLKSGAESASGLFTPVSHFGEIQSATMAESISHT